MNVKRLTLGLTLACAAFAAQAGTYTQTKYPIVLVHGVAGFTKLAGIIDYFYGVPYDLRRDGAVVYAASVSAFSDSETRGSQLANQIVTWAANNGGKVNLFGHSQGAPTSRVAVTLKPNLVASVTSIDGVNKGSKVADVIRGVLPPGSAVEGGAAGLANAFGEIVNWLSNANNQQNAINALWTLTTPGTNDLNKRHGWGVNTSDYCGAGSETVSVSGNSIKMYSWTGSSTYTNVLDVLDPFQAALGKVFANQTVKTSDGLVDICSSKMGKVISTSYDMNHVDAINHTLGTTSIWLNPKTLYRTQANRLKNLGL